MASYTIFMLFIDDELKDHGKNMKEFLLQRNLYDDKYNNFVSTAKDFIFTPEAIGFYLTKLPTFYLENEYIKKNELKDNPITKYRDCLIRKLATEKLSS